MGKQPLPSCLSQTLKQIPMLLRCEVGWSASDAKIEGSWRHRDCLTQYFVRLTGPACHTERRRVSRALSALPTSFSQAVQHVMVILLTLPRPPSNHIVVEREGCDNH